MHGQRTIFVLLVTRDDMSATNVSVKIFHNKDIIKIVQTSQPHSNLCMP